jgi:hypothetical protein
MLLTFQFSLTDLRKFVKTETAILQRPDWPSPQNNEFLRGAGKVVFRPKGGVSIIGEGQICNVKKAFSFDIPPSVVITHKINNKIEKIRCNVVFMQFYSDGIALAKYEIGLRPELPNDKNIKNINLEEMVKSIYASRCHIKTNSGPKKSCTFHEFCKLLPQHYIYATTKQNSNVSYKNWWVESSIPTVYVESDSSDLFQIDDEYKSRSLGDDSSFDLTHRVLNLNKVEFPIRLWHCHNKSKDITTIQNVRKLRLLILRFHAEQESFGCVLRVISSDKLSLEDKSLQTKYLQEFLCRIIKKIKKDKLRLESKSDEVFDEARNIFLDLSGGSVDDKFRKLELQININSQVLRDLRLVYESLNKEDNKVTNNTYNMQNNKGMINISKKMNKVNMHIENMVGSSDSEKQLTDIFEALSSKVASLATTQEEVAPELLENLDILVGEFDKEEEVRNQKLIDISLDGLTEAAKKVGAIGAPILDLLTKLMPIIAV